VLVRLACWKLSYCRLMLTSFSVALGLCLRFWRGRVLGAISKDVVDWIGGIGGDDYDWGGSWGAVGLSVWERGELARGGGTEVRKRKRARLKPAPT
jgi:hypothetical protein